MNFGDALHQLDEDLVVNAAEALLDDLRDLEVDENLIKQLASRIDGIIANLPELLKRYMEREMALQRGQEPHPERIRSAYQYRFTETERREMEEIVRRLAADARSTFLPPGRQSSGRIHVARTLRSSIMYDGILFNPVLTSQRNETPHCGHLRCQPVSPQHRPFHAASGLQPAIVVRAGAQLRVRQRAGRRQPVL